MEKQSDAAQTTTLAINGMSCSGCAHTVQQTLENMEGVKEVAVDLEKSSAAVTYHSNKVTEDDFEQAITSAGYTFKGISHNGNGR